MARVIAQLCIEPLMNGPDQMRRSRGIAYLRTVGALPVFDPDLTGLRSFQIGEARHGFSMYPGWRGKIPIPEVPRDLGQMPPD